MGAIEAFTRSFSLVLANKGLYILALIMALILAPLSAYLIPSSIEYPYQPPTTQRGNVIIEEYGSPIEEGMDLITELLKGLAVFSLISFVLAAIFEYAVTKGVLLYVNGESYRLTELLSEGLRHFPMVVLINFIYTLLMFVFVGIGAIPIIIGAFTLPRGAILIFLGIFLLIGALVFVAGLSVLPVPLYVDKGTFSASFEAIGIAFRNVYSTLGFGALIGIASLGIAIVASPIAFITEIALPENIAPYVSAFLQAPFNALLYVFIWTAGVSFYKELQRMEELKRADEELKELGIEI